MMLVTSFVAFALAILSANVHSQPVEGTLAAAPAQCMAGKNKIVIADKMDEKAFNQK